MNNEWFEHCPACARDREKGNFLAAGGCRACDGKGFRRKAETYVCNGCGGSMCATKGRPDGDSPFGLVEAKVSGHYDSDHLLDGTSYMFSLCEGCLRKMFREFKVKPVVFNYMNGDDTNTFARDEAYYQVRMWRDANGHREKLTTGFCNATPGCTERAVVRHFVSGYMTDEAYCPAHAESHTCLNSRWVDETLCTSIPLEASERSEADKQRLIDLALSWTSKDKPTWVRYVPELVQDVTGCPEATGAFWVPVATQAPAWLMDMLNRGEVVGLVLATGRLFFGAHDVLFRVATQHLDEIERYP